MYPEPRYVMRFICFLLIGFAVTFIIAIGQYYTLRIPEIFGSLPPLWLILLIFLAAGVLEEIRFHRRERRIHGPGVEVKYSRKLAPFTMLALTLLLTWSFPTIILYYYFNPSNMKKAIQIAVLLFSAAAAIILYIRYREKLPSLADKIGFISGVCLGPPTVVEFLL